MKEIVRRSERLRALERCRRNIVRHALASAACVVLLVVTRVMLSNVQAGGDAADPVRYGSLIFSGANMGYVVIGVLAFALGVCVTLLLIRLRELREITGADWTGGSRAEEYDTAGREDRIGSR